MQQLSGQGIIEYFDKFKTDLDWLEYLADRKWANVCKCIKCGNSKYTIRKAMKSSECHPIKGAEIVKEFVFGGKETLKQDRSTDSKKKKIVAAVEIDEKADVKRAYFKLIKDYSSESLEEIFDAHISTEAKIKTNEWTGYKPLKEMYDITQIKSNSSYFFEINTIIHQVNAWLRSTFSWTHEEYIEKYLDEYSYKSNSKQTIFEKLNKRMVITKPLTYSQIIVSV